MAWPAAASGSMRCTSQGPSRRAQARSLDHDGWRAEPFIRGSKTVWSLRTREAVTEDAGTGKATRATDPREVPGCQTNARKQALRPAGALINTDRRCTSTTTARARCMRRGKVSCAHKLTWRAPAAGAGGIRGFSRGSVFVVQGFGGKESIDRKSTRLNSSHSQISYAVFCLK